MAAFVTQFFACPVLIGLWKRFERFRKSRSETFLTILSIGSLSESVARQHSVHDQTSLACHTRITDPEAVPNQVRAQEVVIPNLYYFAAWTDSGCLLGCQHRHATVISAACISEAGGYVIAVQKGELRELNDKEEETFLITAYGIHAASKRRAVFQPVRVLKPSLN